MYLDAGRIQTALTLPSFQAEVYNQRRAAAAELSSTYMRNARVSAVAASKGRFQEIRRLSDVYRHEPVPREQRVRSSFRESLAVARHSSRSGARFRRIPPA